MNLKDDDLKQLLEIENLRKQAIETSRMLVGSGVPTGNVADEILKKVELNIREMLAISQLARTLYNRPGAHEKALRAGAEIEFSIAKMYVFKTLLLEVNRLLGKFLLGNNNDQCREIANESIKEAQNRVNFGGQILGLLKSMSWGAKVKRTFSILFGKEAGYSYNDLIELFRDAFLLIQSIILSFDFDLYADTSPIIDGTNLSARQILENTKAIVDGFRCHRHTDTLAIQIPRYIVFLLYVKNYQFTEPANTEILNWRSYLHLLEGWLYYLLARQQLSKQDPDFITASHYASIAVPHRIAAKIRLRRRLSLLLSSNILSKKSRNPILNKDFGKLPDWIYRYKLNRSLKHKLIELRKLINF